MSLISELSGFLSTKDAISYATIQQTKQPLLDFDPSDKAEYARVERSNEGGEVSGTTLGYLGEDPGGYDYSEPFRNS